MVQHDERPYGMGQAGEAGGAEDSLRGNRNATDLNGAEVSVSAKAHKVSASAGGVTETVGGSNAVTSGTVTTTTVRNDVTRGGGSANVTVGGDGDVALVSATGIGGASATIDGAVVGNVNASRSEEHTSELQSLMRISYAVF